MSEAKSNRAWRLECEALRSALERLREYARHKPSCCWWRGPSCDCGYDTLLAALEETK